MKTQDQQFAPPTSSKFTLAKYKNPFGFSLQVVQSGQNITLGSGGTSVAELDIPMGPADGGVSTGNVADLVLSFTNQPLRSLNDGGFEAFFAAVTDTGSVNMELKGTANVVGRTSIGDVPISGIPFDVQSSLKGINGFGGSAKLSNVSITGSGGNGGTGNFNLRQFFRQPLERNPEVGVKEEWHMRQTILEILGKLIENLSQLFALTCANKSMGCLE